jgi:GNAT superfamily N-acetyltransferase
MSFRFEVATARLPLPSSWWHDFREAWLGFHGFPYRYRLNLLLTRIASTYIRSIVFLAISESTGMPIGALVLDTHRRQIPSGFRSSWISHLWTAPRYRGRGVASALVAESIRAALELGSESIRLAASCPNPSDLYTRAGFNRNSNVGFLRTLSLLVSTPGICIDEFEFPAEIDDLGALAAIAAGPHYQLTDLGTEFSFGIDVEELLCLRLAADHQLGDVFYRRLHGKMFGCWAMPEIGDAIKLLAYAPESSAADLSATDVRGLLSIARRVNNHLSPSTCFPGFVEPHRFPD